MLIRLARIPLDAGISSAVLAGTAKITGSWAKIADPVSPPSLLARRVIFNNICKGDPGNTYFSTIITLLFPASSPVKSRTQLQCLPFSHTQAHIKLHNLASRHDSLSHSPGSFRDCPLGRPS